MRDGLFMAMQYEAITTLTSVVALTEARYGLTAFAETLKNGALSSGTSWTSNTADFVLSGNTAVYTHSTGAGAISQAVGDLSITGRSSRPYVFKYTVSSPANTAPTIVITTAFASTAIPLVGLGAAGDYTVSFTSAVTPGAFTLSGTSSAAGTVTLDNLSLIEQPVSTERKHARRAIISVEDAAIRACWDGSTPTVKASGGVGIPLYSGDIIYLSNPRAIDLFRAINDVAGNGASIRVVYEFV